MAWFGRIPIPEGRDKLPPNDDPIAAPPALPAMSAAREQAIAKAIREGKARTIAHALFLNRCDQLDLPI